VLPLLRLYRGGSGRFHAHSISSECAYSETAVYRKGKIQARIMAAFEQGADGVIVAGCLEGGCHFQEGNLRAKQRVATARQVLEEAGIEADRLEMFNLSSAEGNTFAQIVETMTRRLKDLGPSPLRRSDPVEAIRDSRAS